MSPFYVKLAGSPVFEATAAGVVPGLKSVQAWFSREQLEVVIAWLNANTAEHEVNGIRYDDGEEAWVEIPGTYHQITGNYQLLDPDDCDIQDLTLWREDSNGLIHLDTYTWILAEAPPVPPTVGDAIHALVQIGTLLGESGEWSSPADFLEDIANLVGAVLPHPGDWDSEADGEYGERARAAAADFLG